MLPRWRGLSSTAEVVAPAVRARRSVLSPEFGVMLAMSGWGVYCGLRVLRAKSQFASELLELETALDDARTNAEAKVAEAAALQRAVCEAVNVLEATRSWSGGDGRARALAILRVAAHSTASSTPLADGGLGVSPTASDAQPGERPSGGGIRLRGGTAEPTPATLPAVQVKRPPAMW